ncbi:DNA mismatch repair endonuclease MutL [Luteibaculum oceani]|uniref:DNA mismatch repair protein MutL n=1 Tax=Luteibaculum oceani TaxID=1294296 RepID=A0A5C6V0H2_9FLAO|nr:DNA mismatch repair endonuclease MutL [Luteibaculum oceani]TXC78679.1 DNA mismatch repair endonuclease MutL [Luteibaculum oceani]
MNIIRLLPDSIANQIAAGEVVQRPASVVKELMENAIDSGATEIKLLVKDSGKSLIQVSDNGCGMSEGDARMAFERHATSKIKNADDLFNLHTKGFRGEALASIAAIAQVELKTKPKQDAVGTRLIIEGSEFTLQEACTCSNGSSFAVKNLFYNTPARRNFLKSDAVEFKHISEEFIRVALPHPEIKFKLEHNKQVIFDLPAGNLRQRVVGIFGKNYNERLVPVEEESLMLNLSGFTGKAQFCRKTRGEQYLFVNRRFIKSNYFNHAIVQAYGDLIDSGSFPSYFLMMEVEPNRIDVNIHPTKTEIKFQDERALYQLIQASVKKSLGIFNVKPSIDFDQGEVPITPVNKGDKIAIPQIKVNPNYNPFKRESFSNSERTTTKAPEKLKELYDIEREFNVDWKKEEAVRPTAPIEWTEKESKEQDNSRKDLYEASLGESPDRDKEEFVQIGQKFILTKIKSGFILIHQQRAHQRVLFERYLTKLASGRSGSQQQLFPERIKINPSDYQLLMDSKEDLEKMGLQFEQFSEDEIVINAVPEGLEMSKLSAFMEEFIELLKMPKLNANYNFQEKLAYGLAACGSIKTGRQLSFTEMQALVGDLFSCKNPQQAPNGKACSVTMSTNDIDKLFN